MLKQILEWLGWEKRENASREEMYVGSTCYVYREGYWEDQTLSPNEKWDLMCAQLHDHNQGFTVTNGGEGFRYVIEVFDKGCKVAEGDTDDILKYIRGRFYNGKL